LRVAAGCLAEAGALLDLPVLLLRAS
jgi:hypothetical protein